MILFGCFIVAVELLYCWWAWAHIVRDYGFKDPALLVWTIWVHMWLLAGYAGIYHYFWGSA